MNSNPLDRIEKARDEVGKTDVSPTVAWSLVAVFLCSLVVPALGQALFGSRLYRSGQAPSAGDTRPGLVRTVIATNRRWLAAATRVEDAVGERSLLVEALRPPTQRVLTGLLGVGTERVYPGTGGWLFYGPDVRYVTGRGFLSTSELRRRAGSGDTVTGSPQPDPRVAILDLHRALAARDIELIVMPTPVKPAVEYEHLSGVAIPLSPAPENPSYGPFVEGLREHGVLVFDVAAVIRDARQTTDGPLYLTTDTHWRPETMGLVAEQLAAFLEENVGLGDEISVPFRSSRIDVTNEGDTVRLLGLGSDQALFSAETVRIRRVVPVNGTRWRSDPNADILLLGDSFTNVFSVQTMGWGDSAGLAEQLSYELGRPVDRISQNDGGAHASRGILATELRRGNDRLDGKRVVVFQFANRELAQGDWRVIDLRLASRPDVSVFATPSDGPAVDTEGVVQAIGPIPSPGSVPYKDQIVAMHIGELTTASGEPLPEGTEALVYLWGMQDDELTPVADYRVGDSIALRLEAWAHVANDLDGVNRGEVDDPAVQLAQPWWGQLREVSR